MSCDCPLEYQNHAKEMITTYNLSEIDGIIISSGDGLVHEVSTYTQVNSLYLSGFTLAELNRKSQIQSASVAVFSV